LKQGYFNELHGRLVTLLLKYCETCGLWYLQFKDIVLHQY